MIAKYFETSFEIENVINSPRVISSCLPTVTPPHGAYARPHQREVESSSLYQVALIHRLRRPTEREHLDLEAAVGLAERERHAEHAVRNLGP